MCLFLAGGALLAGMTAVAGPGRAGPATESDPRAVEVARRTLAAMGGGAAFERLRTLRFDFVVLRGGEEVARRRHVWDRHDGRYRVEWKTKEGEAALALFAVQEPKAGRAWLGGSPAEGGVLTRLLEEAFALFVNDTYWLLMPAKMLDFGVRLARDGESSDGGRLFDVVRLSFKEGVGLTPGDQYWAWVSRSSGLMERWDFLLQGRKPEEKATFLWEDWRDVGGVRLSLRKTSADGRTVIQFEKVYGSEEEDPSAFEPPPPR